MGSEVGIDQLREDLDFAGEIEAVHIESDGLVHFYDGAQEPGEGLEETVITVGEEYIEPIPVEEDLPDYSLVY